MLKSWLITVYNFCFAFQDLTSTWLYFNYCTCRQIFVTLFNLLMELKMFCILHDLLSLFFSSHGTSLVESDPIIQWAGWDKEQDATIYKAFLIARRHLHANIAKYYGPYPVIKKIGIVAYELKLPATAAIHLVFHVSQLKKHVGNQTIHSDLPTPTNRSLLQPQQIVDRRMVKRGTAAAIPFLVLWKNLPLTETTWEYADELCLRFPEFHLEDKVMVMEGALS